MPESEPLYIPPEQIERIPPDQVPRGRPLPDAAGGAGAPPPLRAPMPGGGIPQPLAAILQRLGPLGQLALARLQQQTGTPPRRPAGPATPSSTTLPALGRPPAPLPTAAASFVPLLLAGVAGAVATGLVVATVSSVYYSGHEAGAADGQRRRRTRKRRDRRRRSRARRSPAPPPA